jgi:hypothetical protein
MEWCRSTFGSAPIDTTLIGNGWRYMSEGVFEFKEQKDCVMFLLRWA